MKKILAGILAAAILTGGMLSWFASANPDGLEWSIEKVFGRPELPKQKNGIAQSLKKIQENTAFLPDYNFKTGEHWADSQESGKEGKTLPSAEAGTSISGILGAAMVLSLILLIGFGIRVVRKKQNRTEDNR